MNCITVNATCSFEERSLSRHSSSQCLAVLDQDRDGVVTHEASPVSSHSLHTAQASGPNLNLEHLELLHHWMTQTYLTFVVNDSQMEIWHSFVIREGFKYPFLLQEILAVSAVHLAVVDSPRSLHYYNQALEFQTSALACFHELEGRIDENSCVAVLVFSALIAIHVLADRSKTEDLDNDGFIAYSLYCLRLMQAVGGVVLDGWWGSIRKRPELAALSQPPPSEQFSEATEHFTQLKPLLSNPELSREAVSVYHLAISSLEKMYATWGIPQKTLKTIHPVLAWAVKLPPLYLDLIGAGKPEALIILAYYAAFLSFHEQSWVTGDTGAKLIKAINETLGEAWSRWIVWPNEIVRSVESTVCNRSA